MSQMIRSEALPSVMETKLRAIRRRQVLLAIARAAMIGASVLVAAMLVAMIADWMLILFDTSLRVALSASAVATAAAILVAAGARPLAAALGWKQAAASAEVASPQLEERWTTVASFAGSDYRPTSPVARAMFQQVKSEAAAMGRLVEPRRVVRPRALGPAVLTLTGCAVLLAAFMALGWPQSSVLLQRFWSPWKNITATQLHNVTGDAKIPRGETLELATELAGLARHAATLTIRHESGAIDELSLESDETQPQRFLHSLRVEESFRYQFRAGDGQTEWHRVTAIDYPKLAEVQFSITAPDYVNRPALEKTLIPRRVKVVQGSRLELRMKPSTTVERLELTLTAKSEGEKTADQVLALTPDADGWYRFETALLQDFSFAPTLVNEHGLTNQEKSLCSIQVIPDQAPVARILSPTEEMAVAADEAIEIKFEAHDDHGVATAELIVYDESGAEPKIIGVQPIPLGDQRLEKYVTASARLDLKELNLAPGADISYAIRVTDSRQPATDLAVGNESVATSPSKSENELSAHAAEAAEPSNDDAKRQVADSQRKSATPPAAGDPRSDLESMLAAVDPRSRENTANPDATESDAESTTSDSHVPPSEEVSSATSAKASAAVDAQQGKSENGAEGGIRPSPETDEATAAVTRDSNSGEPQEAPASDKPGSEETTEENPINSETTTSPVEVARSDPSETSEPEREMAPAANADAENPAKQSDSTADVSNPEPGVSSQPKQPPDRDSQRATSAAANPFKISREDPDADPPKATPTSKDEEPIVTNEKPEPSAEEAGASKQQQASNSTSKSASASDSDALPHSQSASETPQQAVSGQNSETTRRRLKITDELAAVAEVEVGDAERMEIRDRVVQIDKMLAAIEAALMRVVAREIADSNRGEQFRTLDANLGDVEEYIAHLHEETKDDALAFVGLQMVDIGRSHVTPARDRIFTAARDLAGAEVHADHALQHVVRARELLAALLERYDRVVRDRDLAESIDESVKMYEVYVEKMQQLMREARQNANPLDRKMAVIEVDQEYLDRFAEVLTLRREMLSEFGRMLADDPRLLARYLDLIKRRRASLRDQLSELAQRQDEISSELSGWLQADEDQRQDIWTLLTDLRFQATTELANEAAELAERIEKQMPLSLEPSQETPAATIRHAQEIARITRSISLKAPEFRKGVETPASSLVADAEGLVSRFSQLEAALDQLNFENEAEEEVTLYVSARLQESRAVADRADAWFSVARHLQEHRYAGFAEVDQQSVSIATELLRLEMLGIEADLNGQFQQQTESGLPAEIANLVYELHRVMEAVALNQAAATFATSRDQLAEAELQQAKALAGFDRAQELFDRIRREVTAALDEYDVPDPNIADLIDPTLDEFLRRLEREPNIEAQLGIPNRPRNLRVIADTLELQQNGGQMLGDSAEDAMQRARQEMKPQRKPVAKNDPPAVESTDQERQQMAKEKDMQDVLAKSLASLDEKIKDPSTSPQERRKLEQMAEGMRRMLEQIDEQSPDAKTWNELAESNQAKEVLQALARGEAIPDQQWNKLLSTLEDGLWQVRGKAPPADYRKAIEQYQERLRQIMKTEE